MIREFCKLQHSLIKSFKGESKTEYFSDDFSDDEQDESRREVGPLIYLIAIISATVPVALIWFDYYNAQVYPTKLSVGLSCLFIGLFAGIFFILARRMCTVWMLLHSLKDIIYSQILSVIIADFVFYMITALLIRNIPNVAMMLIVLIVQIGLISVGSVYIEKSNESGEKRR